MLTRLQEGSSSPVCESFRCVPLAAGLDAWSRHLVDADHLLARTWRSMDCFARLCDAKMGLIVLAKSLAQPNSLA